MPWRRIGITTAGILAMALIWVAMNDRAWIGSFPLTVEVVTTDPIDETRLVFAACIDQADVDVVMKTDSPIGSTFDHSERVGVMTYRIEVTCMGRSNPLGLSEYYHEPKFLVVGYSKPGSDSKSRVWKQFTIPIGHGPRTLRLPLP